MSATVASVLLSVLLVAEGPPVAAPREVAGRSIALAVVGQVLVLSGATLATMGVGPSYDAVSDGVSRSNAAGAAGLVGVGLSLILLSLVLHWADGWSAQALRLPGDARTVFAPLAW
ncbi:MAG: hypothetical protein K1X89_04110 [Myxococcaceae bacterium]|nr:hypothetical protein [Myxococcaceae bacterium]